MTARLVEDLEWDSLTFAIVAEALLERRPQTDTAFIDGLITLGDVYHFYTVFSQ